MRTYRRRSSSQITRREILFSIIIITVMLALGFFISGSISNSIAENNEVYYKAVKINQDKDQFTYGMSTNIGNALVHGKFISQNSVSFPELTSEYFWTEKVSERYTRHTRTVTTTDSNGKTHTKTEVYYTWDTIKIESKQAPSILFLDVEFDSSKFDISAAQTLRMDKDNVSENYHTWISGSHLYKDGDKWASVGDIRYYYRIIPTEFYGTILTKLRNNSIFHTDNDAWSIDVKYEKTIEEIIAGRDEAETLALIGFWIVWILLIGGCVYWFYYAENEWLED